MGANPKKACPSCRCLKDHTPEHWYFREDGTTSDMCIACEDSRPQRMRRVLVQEYMEKLVHGVRAGAVAVPQMSEFVAKMFAIRGGVQVVCEQWWDALDNARTANKHKAVLDFYHQLFSMVNACSDDIKQDVTAMTDDDLAEALASEIARYLPVESDGSEVIEECDAEVVSA